MEEVDHIPDPDNHPAGRSLDLVDTGLVVEAGIDRIAAAEDHRIVVGEDLRMVADLHIVLEVGRRIAEVDIVEVAVPAAILIDPDHIEMDYRRRDSVVELVRSSAGSFLQIPVVRDDYHSCCSAKEQSWVHSDIQS